MLGATVLRSYMLNGEVLWRRRSEVVSSTNVGR